MLNLLELAYKWLTSAYHIFQIWGALSHSHLTTQGLHHDSSILRSSSEWFFRHPKKLTKRKAQNRQFQNPYLGGSSQVSFSA